VHGLLTNRPLIDCLLVANACGALSATGIGGTAAQPDASTLSVFLALHKAEVAAEPIV
jgi:sugar/nucleoside kinase (ribokinase family)